MTDKVAVAKRKSQARKSKKEINAYSQHVQSKLRHQCTSVTREEFVRRTAGKGQRPASAKMINYRRKHMKRLARSQRPASARKIARSGDRENKAPGRVEVGFKTLLSQNQMSKRGGEKNAPKKVKNGKADRVDKMIQKMRMSFQGKSHTKLFRTMDREHKGWMSASDVKHMFKMLAMPIKDNDLSSLMKKFDTNGDGSIQYGEFLHLVRFPLDFHSVTAKVPPKWKKVPPKVDAYTMHSKQPTGYNTTKKDAHTILRRKFLKRGHLRKIFLQLDQERDGSVSFESFRDLLDRYHIRMPEQEMTAMFGDLDRNSDGEIQYDEFRDWLFSSSPQTNEEPQRISLREKNKIKQQREITSKIGSTKVPMKQVTRTQQRGYQELKDSLANSESATRGAGNHKARLILNDAAKKLRRHRIAARSAFKSLSSNSAEDSLSAVEFCKISGMIEKKDGLDSPLLTPKEMKAVTAFLQRDKSGQRSTRVSYKDFDRWFLKNHQTCIINGDGSMDADQLASNSSNPDYQRQNSNARAMIFRPRSNDMHIWKPHFNFESLMKNQRHPTSRQRDRLRNRMRKSSKNLIASSSEANASRWRSVSSAIGRGHMAVIRARKAAATR